MTRVMHESKTRESVSHFGPFKDSLSLLSFLVLPEVLFSSVKSLPVILSLNDFSRIISGSLPETDIEGKDGRK